MRDRTAALAAMTLLAATVACAPGLRQPPTLAELAGGAVPADGRPAAELVAEAESLYGRRTMADVRRAAELWLGAAARSGSERVAGLLGAARARVWLAIREPDSEARRAAAVSAVQAAQLCGSNAPDELRCDYWLAVALGVQARERRATGLDALPRIIELLDRVAEAQPEIDHGGPDRVLALLYLRAPGWPRGPGDEDLGLEHAQRAVALTRDYPPNLVALAEALEATGSLEAAGEARAEAAQSARAWIEKGEPEAEEWLAQATDPARH